MTAPEIRIRAIELFERPVRFRLPFRFGAVTLTHARQAFLRMEIETRDGGTAIGVSADLLASKWFDKRPELSPEETVEELVEALLSAREEVRADHGFATVFDHALALGGAIRERLAARGMPGLVAAFAIAQLERAMVDALCRHRGQSVFEAVSSGLLGIDGRLLPERAEVDVAGALSGIAPARRIWLRHTVGMLDPLREDEVQDGPEDGLPVSLEAVVTRHAIRFFKLKLGGDLEADHARLRDIARLLDRLAEPYHATLDGNEQYADPGALEGLLDRIEADRRLERLRSSILYIEQPLPRALTFEVDLGPLAERVPFLIDEADDRPDSFPRARIRGYRGVSVKACKGFFGALANRLRCDLANAEAGRTVAFPSSEDLTTQPGVALQQDLALAALCGCVHSEKNGHHFAGGMQGAPAAEKRAFAEAHGDLYRLEGEELRLGIEVGRLRIGSLACPGYGSAVLPDFGAMQPLARGGTGHG